MTEPTYQEVMDLIEQGKICSHSALLYQLKQNTVNHWLSSVGLSGKRGVQIGVDEVTHEMRSELLQLLHQLKESGVVSQRVGEQLHADIIAGRIVLNFMLFQHAAMQMEICERFQPEQQQPLLNSLRSAGILSSFGYTQLLQNLQDESIQDDIEFFKYIDRALIFNMRDYSLDPDDYFPKIHASIAQMLHTTGIANMTLDNFSLEIVPESDFENHYKAIVSVLVNGKQYQQSRFYSPTVDENYFCGRIDSDEFIHLFNKILRDIGSPYRLYNSQALSYELGVPSLDDSRFGVIALTENQAKVYFKDDTFCQETQLTTDRIEEILTLFQRIGLFDDLTQEQIALGRKQIIQSYITHPYELLEAFENLVVTVEWESDNLESHYQVLTDELAAASRGAFAPTDISNKFDWETQTTRLSLMINGKRYSTKLKHNSDFLDSGFFAFIQQVVEQTILDGRFYPLYEGDYNDVSGYIFLSTEQRHVLESEGLLSLNRFLSDFGD